MIDSGMGEAAISGCCDVIGSHMNPDGTFTFSFPSPEPALWPWIFGFIVIQALLILAIIRLREPQETSGPSLSG
jgi:hypothetical protein